MLPKVAVVLFGLYASACLAEDTDAVSSSATIVLAAENVRDEGVTIRGVRMETFPANGCSKPVKLTNFFLRKKLSQRSSDAATIPAGQPIGLTVSYSDARHAENRSCAISGHFTPKPGSRYVVNFHVNQGAQSCTVTLLDQDSATTDFMQQPLVCLVSTDEAVESGVGYVLKWNIRARVQTTP